MTSSSKRRALAFGLVGAVALATPSLAAPVLSSTVGVKAAVANDVVDVRWRGHHGRGAGVAAGVAFGALAGAAIGAATAPYYGYPAYGYGYPGYAYSYPAYGAYAYGAPAYYGSYAY